MITSTPEQEELVRAMRRIDERTLFNAPQQTPTPKPTDADYSRAAEATAKTPETPVEGRSPAVEPKPANGAVDPLPPTKGDDGPAVVVFRYTGPGEAKAAETTGKIPNTDQNGVAKVVFVTPDKLETPEAAEETLQIGRNDPRGPQPTPTHRITGNATGIQFDTAGKVGSPGGTQPGVELTTRQEIPVINIELLVKLAHPTDAPK